MPNKFNLIVLIVMVENEEVEEVVLNGDVADDIDEDIITDAEDG